jgi:hypothetical protein
MPSFRWKNWITDDPRDLEEIARSSPHALDRLEAVRLLTNSHTLRELSRELSGEASAEAQRRADDIDYDYDD